MGYALMFGSCISCHKPFGFNPHRVPSVTVDGHREPVCLDCVNKYNPVRKFNGLPEIVPHPDAYEPVNEDEL